jgi:hypothetical protein
MSLVGLFLVAVPVAEAVSCLIFPLSCLKTKKKYGDEVDATVISIDTDHTKVVYLSVPSVYDQMGMVGLQSSPLDNTREYFVSFQVGMTRYVAWKKDTVVQMAGVLGGYTPKREEWVGHTFKMRFVDENWLGIKAPTAVFKTPKGKEWKLVIVDIIGPDGVDECKPYFGLEMNLGHCQQQADIDRSKREEEILAALKEKGIDKPLWDLQDAALAQAIHRQRGGTLLRQGQIGARVSHDASAPAANVPHPDVSPAQDSAAAPVAAGNGSASAQASAPATASVAPTDAAAAVPAAQAAEPAPPAPPAPAAEAAPPAPPAPAAEQPPAAPPPPK